METVLLIGLGRFGRHMAAKLIEEGNKVLAIDISEERANNCVNLIPNIQIADATKEGVIASLGVDNFDICVVAIGDDFETALVTTVLLKDYGAKYIVARARRDVHKKLLLRNGADYVVYAEKDVAERLAITLGDKKIFDFVKLNDAYGIYEIATPASWIGRTIVDVDVRRRHNVNILASVNGEDMKPNIDPSYIFNNSERLLVLGSIADIRKLTRG